MTATADLQRPTRLLSGPLLIVTLINLVYFSGFLFFFPTLPLFIEALGGRDSEIGLLIGVSSLSALLLRPVVGYYVDSRGRKIVLIVGLVLFIVNSLLHNVVTDPIGMFPIRVISGASLAAVITAATTIIADLAPPEKRGQVISYFALSNAVGFAIGPALGGYLIHASIFGHFDRLFTSRLDWIAGSRTGDLNFTTLFLVAAAIGTLALILALRLPESRPQFDAPPKRPGPGDFFARQAALPAMVNFAAAFSFSGMVTFVPLFARDLGLANPGSIFVVYAVSVIVARFAVSPFIDRVSRAAVIIPGIGSLVGAMVVVALAGGVGALFVAAALWGIGSAVFQPALMAYTVDRTPPEIRGRAMATFTMGMDLGIGVGAFTLGLFVEASGMRAAYTMAAIVVTVGLLVFTAAWYRDRRAGITT